jgi:hypothetical protein
MAASTAASTPAPRAAATDLLFTGSLQRVTRQTITIKQSNAISIDALLPEKGGLSSETIVAKLKAGDQVEITCRPTPATYDEDSSEASRTDWDEKSQSNAGLQACFCRPAKGTVSPEGLRYQT